MSIVKESGQPHKVYTYPLDVVLYLRDKLGVAEGLIDFQHPFKHAENIIDLIETVMEYQKQGLLVNEFTKQECKTEINIISVNKLKQIWENQTFLIRTFDKIETTKETSEEIVFKRPNPKPNQEYRELPSLSSLKPTEDKQSNPMLIAIGEAVLENEAYKSEDPQQLCDIGGCYYQVGNQKIPWFRSQEDIENSFNYTKRVGRNYYDNTRKSLFRAWKKQSIILKTNIVILAKEIQGFDYEVADRVADVTKVE